MDGLSQEADDGGTVPGIPGYSAAPPRTGTNRNEPYENRGGAATSASAYPANIVHSLLPQPGLPTLHPVTPGRQDEDDDDDDGMQGPVAFWNDAKIVKRLDALAATIAKPKLPADTYRRVKKVHSTFTKHAVAIQTSKSRLTKLAADLKVLGEGKIPASCKSFSLGFETEDLDKTLPTALSLSFTTSSPMAIREACYKLNYVHEAAQRRSLQTLNEEQTTRHQDIADYDVFINSCMGPHESRKAAMGALGIK